MKEAQPEFYVDQYGNRIADPIPREGDVLDVGFGGPIGNLMEKLAYAKQVMDISDELYPYEKTGVKKTGKLTAANEEITRANTKSLKSLREEVDDDYEPTPQPIKQIPKSVNKPTATPFSPPAKPKKQPVYEDENYIYYTKNGVNEDDEYDVRKAPSLTQELLTAAKNQSHGQTLPDMSTTINERMVQKSKLPDVIKQSFLKNPLTPPKLTAVLGGGQLDAITEQFRKQKLLKNPQKSTQELIAVPKKQVTEQKVDPIPQNKREKIKAQLRPIVEELIREILLDRL